jgi:hypothetical protein
MHTCYADVSMSWANMYHLQALLVGVAAVGIHLLDTYNLASGTSYDWECDVVQGSS